MKILKWITSIIISFTLVSCDTYSTNDLIQEGAEIKNVHSLKLNKLIAIAENLTKDDCVVYQISTSRRTDYFNFEEFYYNKEENEVVFGNSIDYNEELVSAVKENMVYEEMTDFSFLKDVYVAFVMEFHRDKKLNYASLIYCINKEKFFNLFPDYKVYNEKTINELKDISENWVYFYDNNWAITTSSTVYKISKDECNQIMMK